MLADHAFNKDGSFRYVENVDLGFRGDTMLVNGAVVAADGGPAPDLPAALPQRVQRPLVRPQARQRAQMLQIASDGGLLERPVSRTSFPLHPAERIEVLIDFRGFRPGSEIVLQNIDGEATAREGGHALRRRARRRQRGGADAARAGCARSRSCRAPNASRRWDLSLLTRAACSGRSPTAASTRTASTSRRGWARSELWQWHNPSNRVHPMHLHGMLFRVVERSSGVVHPGERGWKDTVGVLPGETVTVQPWFVPYAAATSSTAIRSNTATRR